MAKKNLPHDSTKEEVCKRLVLLRKARGLNQKEMAAQAGLGTTQWANYEALKRMPNIEDMIRLANEQNISLDYIYRGLMPSLPYQLAMKINGIIAAESQGEWQDEKADDDGASDRSKRAAAR